MNLLLWIVLGTAWATTSTELLTAMEVDTGDVSDESIDAGATNAYSVETALGTIAPTQGSDFAWLHTGYANNPPAAEPGDDLGAMGAVGDYATLAVDLVVPTGINSALLDFYFLSAEYPEWLGSPFNDTFEINVTGTAYTGNAAQDSSGNDISINSVLFTVTTPSDLAGTGYGGGVGGGTGWLTIAIPVDEGDTVTLEITVRDVSDGSYDSSALVDNFEWSEDDIDEPIISEPIDLFYLTPKRGHIDGGETTSIIGDTFDSSCVASFDGIEAATTHISDTELEAVTPPHAEGLVDITVDCLLDTEVLIGGYTYYENVGGEDSPPVVDAVNPWMVDADGGETVSVRGENFDEGAVVSVDGTAVTTTWVSETKLSFLTPAHAEGSADITVTNKDSLTDTLAGGLYYLADTDAPVDTGGDTGPTDTESSDTDDTDLPEACSCATPGAGALPVLLTLIGAVAARRRQR